MVDFKCGDTVQVKARLVSGEINVKCKVIEFLNDNGFPKQPTFRTMQDCGQIRKGQVFGGSASDVVALCAKSNDRQL